MTLREFIEQEIKEDHVFDFEEFRRKLYMFVFEDGGEKIEPEKMEDYLDYYVGHAAVIHNFGTFAHLIHYNISMQRYREG